MPQPRRTQKVTNSVWTADNDKELVGLREQGVSYNHIAKILKRTNDACRTRFKNLKKTVVEDKVVTETAVNGGNELLWPPPMDEEFEIVEEGRAWTDSDLETLFEMRNAGVPYNMIATELKRSPSAVKSKWNATDWESMPFYDDARRLSAERYADEKKEFQDKIIRAADRRHDRHKMGLDIFADRLERAIKALPNIAPPAYNPNRDIVKAHKEEDVMLILSDIHIGAEHSYEETGGISEFNRTRCYKRLDNLQYAVRDIVELHSKLYNLPHLHLSCLGDIVAGDNSSGEWSQNYISMPIVEQVVEGYNKIRDMLAYWLTIFPEITFYGVRGNHGRTGQKGVEKDYSNYDYLLYRFLQASFKDNPRIKFIVPKTWWILAEIRGWKFLMVHGDDVRGGTVPIKKLNDFESKMVGIIKQIPDYTIAGHYHNSAELSTNNGCVILNGSVIGGDVYSLKTVHANSRPEQTIFGINDSHGRTWKYNINLDVEREPG